MATDEETTAAGFTLPQGYDELREGADDISHNARAALDLFKSYRAYVQDVSGIETPDDLLAVLAADRTSAFHQSASAPRHKTARDFGVPLDGVTDATAALNAIPAGQGEVVLRGDFNITGPVTVQPGTTLRGTGPRSDMQLIAAPGFSGAHMVNLGGGATCHSTRIEHATIDGRGRVATAVKGEDIQELSGLTDVLIGGFTSIGADFTGAGTSQNYVIAGVELYGHTAADNMVGIRTEPGAPVQAIRDVTVILGTLQQAAGAGSVGIEANGPINLASGLHFESVETGLLLNGATGSVVTGVSGVGLTGVVSTLVKVVNTPQGNITLAGLFGNGSTLVLDDQLHGYTYAGDMALYAWGGGAIGSDSVLNIGDPNRRQRFHRLDLTAEMFCHLGEAGQVYVGDGVVAWGGDFDVELRRTAAGSLSMAGTQTFKTGQAATASRPSAATRGKGAQFYDTTLNRPIWSDGVTWRDAAGTAV